MIPASGNENKEMLESSLWSEVQYGESSQRRATQVEYGIILLVLCIDFLSDLLEHKENEK